MQVSALPFTFSAETLGGGVALEKPSRRRSVGMHVSEIIRDIDNKIINKGKRQHRDDMTPEDLEKMTRYAELGFTWEVVFDHFFRQRMISWLDPATCLLDQEELECDGIYMTPDALYIPTWTLLEFKCTWKSQSRAENLESEFWAWMAQMKAYCYAFETTRAQLYVFWVNGNYKPQVPMTTGYEITFTEDEILDNWSLLTKHAKTMEPRWNEANSGDAPSATVLGPSSKDTETPTPPCASSVFVGSN